jgi:general secretion pathway protein H
MPRSATGAISAVVRRAPRGFTLIELLVVLVIAGVLGGVALLTLGAPDAERQAARSLERAVAAMDAMCERALFEARPWGVRFGDGGYDFWFFDGAEWQLADRRRTDSQAPPHAGRWPAGIDVRVEVERFDTSRAAQSVPQAWCTGIEPPPTVLLEAGDASNRQRLSWPR